MANVRAELAAALRRDAAHDTELTDAIRRDAALDARRRAESSPAVNQAYLNPLGFYVATTVSWLSGLMGVGLIYHAAESDLLFLSGLACLVFAAALSRTARAALSSAIERALRGLGMGRQQAAERAEQLASELWLKGVRGRDPRP